MGALVPPVPIVGAGAVSAHGRGWRGLGQILTSVRCQPTPSIELAVSHPGTLSFEVESLTAPESVVEKRARLLMSRSAVLASMASAAVLHDADWREGLEDVGFYLGVGASGGSIEQLTALLAASVRDHELSLTRFGEEGLAAVNPLFAFQLMNNFTLCHSAILHGTQGPNAAFFSRGTGTVVALLEAAHAVLGGECDRALAGGADSSVHAVTWAELVREGWAERGLVPGEGAALLALARPTASGRALGFLEYVSVTGHAGLDGSGVDAVIVAPWGPPARESIAAFADAVLPGCPVLDVSMVLGESLAASPALAWAVALDLLASEQLARVVVVSHGLDGDVGIVALRSGAV